MVDTIMSDCSTYSFCNRVTSKYRSFYFLIHIVSKKCMVRYCELAKICTEVGVSVFSIIYQHSAPLPEHIEENSLVDPEMR